ncbi:Clp protease N-terminal domain-containing protein [Nocardia sp. NPDC051052]|uniref:Clp protease N-terminal domain-containing protein n=1 Tax=Nocardia sp. NPDC051052 TaxID=3364322 RepID=UPI0037A44733
MDNVDFTVTNVFDISGRGVIMVAGRLASGVIEGGDILYDSITGARITVAGLEFHGGREPDEHVLVVPADEADRIHIDQHLTDQRPDDGLTRTPRLLRILDAAPDIAKAQGHDYVGVEHLMLAILADPDAVPTQHLRKLGLDPDNIAQTLQEYLREMVSSAEDFTDGYKPPSQ